MFKNDDNKGAEILVSFLIGGIVGAGLAFLFAPQSGKKTRARIVDMADDIKESASDYAKKLKARVS